MVIKGFLPVPKLSWFVVQGRDTLTKWEQVLLDVHDQSKSVETLMELCAHLNYYLDLPFNLHDTETSKNELFEYYVSELKKMVVPPTDDVVSNIGILTLTETENDCLSVCVTTIMSTLRPIRHHLDRVSNVALYPPIETKLGWFLPCRVMMR